MSNRLSKNSDNLLMVFVKNPILGAAKTRLAASIGAEKTLEIYTFLLQYTSYLAGEIDCDRRIYYSNQIDNNDMFPNQLFSKTVQQDGDLGDKMFAAFQEAFQEKYKRVVIIGSDCYELSAEIIEDAFAALNQADFVIGPAVDGGYYLLGMRTLERSIFKNKKWSTARVYLDTVVDLEALNYPYAELPTLNDIDYLEDMSEELRTKFGV